MRAGELDAARGARARPAVVAAARRARAHARPARRSRRRRRRSRTASQPNLGGGTHHAFADSGRGFCVFNDVVAALRALRVARPRPARARRRPRRPPGRRHALAAGARTPDAFTFSVNGVPRTTRSGACPATSSSTCRTARATTRYLDGARRGCCRRRSRGRGRSSASTSPAPTRTRATGSGASRCRRQGSRQRDRLVRDTLRAAGHPGVRHARGRLRRADRGHRRDQPGDGSDVRRRRSRS